MNVACNLLIEGVALLAGFLGPCGMNTPHTHPRATEFLYLVNGTLQNGMITETGSRFIVNNITGGQGILLPQVRKEHLRKCVSLTEFVGFHSLSVQ